MTRTAPGVDPVVGGITLDSRWVESGDVYVALPGLRTHGARFAADAVALGAVVLLTDAAGATELHETVTDRVPVLVADDPRMVMGELAARLYDHPGDALTMIGITGTNGKTTTAFLVEAALRRIGRRVGVIGTLGFRLDGVDLGGSRTTVTTPESVDLHALLALFRERGADAVVMEVSSHALALQRVAGIRFAVAAFTNLGRDHLDFHADMEDYFAAKASLFVGGRTRTAVINVADAYGRRLRAQLDADRRVQVVTTSTQSDAREPEADWSATEIRADRTGSQVALNTPTGPLALRLGLPGRYNVDNAVIALALVAAVGDDPALAAVGLGEAAVPGRMQQVDLGPDAPTVVVDFAHTPQAVTAALHSLNGDRVVAVLGAGGERDRAKRAPMGAAAARSADVVVVTDDNPRSEDPAAIRAEVLAGARSVERPRAATILDGGDRRRAIRLALAEAVRPGSSTSAVRGSAVVAILGKGHEHGQQLVGPDGAPLTLPFDDVLVAAEEWLRLQDQTGAVPGSTTGASR